MLHKTSENEVRKVSFFIRFSLEFSFIEFVKFVHFLESFLINILVFWLQTVLKYAFAFMNEALCNLNSFSSEFVRFAHEQTFYNS